MADRFPLIIDNSAEKIKELVSGDNLDLTKSNLKNADHIQSAGVNVAGVATATSLIGDGSQLTNLPPSGGSLTATASGTLSDGSTVLVNADGTVSAVGLEGSGWIATLGGTGTEYGYGVAYDSSGNVYITGYTNSAGAGGNELLIAKYNSSGTIQWQRTLGTGTAYRHDDSGRMIAVDSSGNVYVNGTTNFTGGYDSMMIAKYNSSGTLQWQKTFGDSNTQERGHGITVDSSGNVFVCGETTKGVNGALVAKLNSSGTLQWQRTLDASLFYEVVVDSSDNVYVGGYTAIGSYTNYLAAKYNNSGTLQWQRTIGGSTASDNGRSITIDSSDNVYIGGVSTAGGVGVYDSILVKYNSSGTYQWQKALGTSGTQINIQAIASDSSDNVYIAGSWSNSYFFAKYDSDGNLDWQRSFGGSGTDNGHGISADGNGNIYVIGNTASSGAGSNDILLITVPSDGSGTGTYGSFTYAASSHTENTPSHTSSDPSKTAASGTLNSPSNGSFTDQSVSLSDSTISMASTNLTSENYIGISDGAYSNGQTATVQIIGAVDDAQSSLTPGQSYYVQTDGTLSTTADSPSVFAGTAIAATKLIVRG